MSMGRSSGDGYIVFTLIVARAKNLIMSKLGSSIGV